jgi:hypothetical protein
MVAAAVNTTPTFKTSGAVSTIEAISKSYGLMLKGVGE